MHKLSTEKLTTFTHTHIPQHLCLPYIYLHSYLPLTHHLRVQVESASIYLAAMLLTAKSRTHYPSPHTHRPQHLTECHCNQTQRVYVHIYPQHLTEQHSPTRKGIRAQLEVSPANWAPMTRSCTYFTSHHTHMTPTYD